VITVWKVIGHRDLPKGGSRELLSTAFGSDEAAARRNFDRCLNKAVSLDGRATWQPSELTFTQVQQK
jgi:hypothetical protein